MKDLIGKWAFVAGVIIAVLLGLVGTLSATMAVVLVILGILVGLLNITSKETTPFLLAGVSLLIATYWGGQIMSSVPVFQRVLGAMMMLTVPAVIIVALRAVFTIAKNK